MRNLDKFNAIDVFSMGVRQLDTFEETYGAELKAMNVVNSDYQRVLLDDTG